LADGKKYCSVCGYQLSKDEFREVSNDEIQKGYTKREPEAVKSNEADDDNNINENEDYDDFERAERTEPTEAGTRPSSTYRITPAGTKVKEKIPKSTNCSVCGSKTGEICFFCDWAVCKRHNVNMRIVTDTGKFGNVIQSCPDCAERKDGRQPSTEEAADVGFFFKIKPYHEWKIVR
jgi:hypothetical protein